MQWQNNGVKMNVLTNIDIKHIHGQFYSFDCAAKQLGMIPFHFYLFNHDTQQETIKTIYAFTEHSYQKILRHLNDEYTNYFYYPMEK